jgi:hypothetical protein
MISSHKQRVRLIALLAVTSVFTVAASQAATANVTYTASGTLGSIISGQDMLKLSGQTYSISIVANAAATPVKSGSAYAVYTPVRMSGNVTTGLTNTSEPIGSSTSSLLLEIVPKSANVFEAVIPIKVLNLSLTIKAIISLPVGTLASLHPHPFSSPVTLTPAMGSVTYSDGTNSSTISIGNGKLDATAPSGTTSSPLVHAAGAEVVTFHPDATRTAHLVSAGPVEMGNDTDRVTLQFYASGVTGASDVRVQIAGEDAMVLYAGPSGHFLGLDQVVVEVPRSLAGRGDAEVVMSVDGETASPLHILIQ